MLEEMIRTYTFTGTDPKNMKGKRVLEKIVDYIIRDEEDKKSLRTRIKEASQNRDYELLSRLFQKFVRACNELKKMSEDYADNFVY
jgi:hypothetical protein